MKTLEISAMTSADIPKIHKLEALCFSSPWSEAALYDELENESARFLVCKIGDEVAGYVGSLCVLDECSITNVAVFPEFRRQSVGASLIKALCAIAKKEKITSIFLEVRKSNDAACKLYEKCGFSVCGERKNFYSAPTEDAYIMNIKL